MNNKFKNNIIFFCLIAAIVGGAALFAFSDDPGKSFFNYRLYAVKTPSMAPKEDGSSPPGGFRAGDLILVKMCEPETVSAGDIITYVPGADPRVYLTHRVVKVLDSLNDDKGLFFVTRGDANDADDPPVSGDMVIGKKILAIPGGGTILEFVRGNLVLSMLIIVFGFGAAFLLRLYFRNPDKEA